MVGELNSVFLPEDSKILRQPIAPEIPRSDQFMAEFDQRGIFYSIFRDISGKRVWFLGPELMNLERSVLPMWVEGAQSGVRTQIQFLKNDHVCVGYAELPRDEQELLLEVGEHSIVTEIGKNYSAQFKDARVVYCINKDNDLRWVKDWATFYVKEHGADAFIIFDNNSQTYTPLQLEVALREVSGINRANVINWPFKFGAIDPVAQKLGKPAHILFAQRVAHMELFLRYGVVANSILNVDIDELVISAKRRSVLDVVQQRFFGCIKFDRYLVENAREYGTANDLQSFRDYYLRNKLHLGRQDKYKKWAIAPSRLRSIQKTPILWTHRIYGALNPYPTSKEFKCYHFAGITCDWRRKEDREVERVWQHSRSNQLEFDQNLHVKDEFLAEVLHDVFDEQTEEAVQ